MPIEPRRCVYGRSEQGAEQIDQGIVVVRRLLSSGSRREVSQNYGHTLDQKQTRAFVIAWAFTVTFYFLEYAVRSSPAVMIPELEASFHTTALGISAILGCLLLHLLHNELGRRSGP